MNQTKITRRTALGGMAAAVAAPFVFRNFAGAAQMLRHYVSEEDPSEDGPAFRAHYLLGVVLEKQGKKKEAAAEFQSALNMASEYRPAQDALARVSR